MTCLACREQLAPSAHPTTVIRGNAYTRCSSCGSIFVLDVARAKSACLTQNDTPEDRNELSKLQTRYKRAKDALGNTPERWLDFGCGKGELIYFLLQGGVSAAGIDIGTELQPKSLKQNQYDVISMIEVIEHLENPIETIKDLWKALKPGGVLMIETTFAESIKDLPHKYVDPEIGHICIISREWLIMRSGVMQADGDSAQTYNPHVVTFKKGT